MEKRRNCFSFPQYFQYISFFRSQITYSFVKCGCLIYLFFLNSEILICRDTDISKYFRESLDFEITRVDCTLGIDLFSALTQNAASDQVNNVYMYYSPSSVWHIIRLYKKDFFIYIIFCYYIIFFFYRTPSSSCKQCRHWSDTVFYGVWSGSTLATNVPHENKPI